MIFKKVLLVFNAFWIIKLTAPLSSFFRKLFKNNSSFLQIYIAIKRQQKFIGKPWIPLPISFCIYLNYIIINRFYINHPYYFPSEINNLIMLILFHNIRYFYYTLYFIVMSIEKVNFLHFFVICDIISFHT